MTEIREAFYSALTEAAKSVHTATETAIDGLRAIFANAGAETEEACSIGTIELLSVTKSFMNDFEDRARYLREGPIKLPNVNDGPALASPASGTPIEGAQPEVEADQPSLPADDEPLAVPSFLRRREAA